ncbi:hypothetical protein OIDMADRAFT_109087 [Oidiodendron maius Zn]|uniref:Carboxylic ester hydrolase n=1 Tax=Oidiodendron maius (strain Zn) TaxID=913774 RepID=A0A0C3HX06_OIDMZ|nr:hypothetical protein OIDMADRAFT_109087 [Oidiodendron maius Zn]
MSLYTYLTLATALLGLIIGVNSNPLSTRSSSGPVVDLGYSKYEGTALSSGVNQYLGMRFAAPPIGNLRYRAPEEPLPTTDIESATEFRPVCLAMGTMLPNTGQAEDCLFANVWCPSLATPRSKLPVWVYIQGGGYTQNGNANYNGSTVVETSGNNIVFVNFNYRVGSWGFLASEKVRKNGNLNAGLLDQDFLLRWVRKNIEQFGGDPNHVIIHGSSAGAGSVALHLTAYGGVDRGLFIGAIGESVFFPAQPKIRELEWQFDRYVTNTGCSHSTDQLECLRALDTETLQAANVATPFPGGVSPPLFYFTPTIDGHFIQDYPYVSFGKGNFVHVPIIIGDDNDEGTFFVANASSPADVTTFFVDNYPRLTTHDTDAINAVYPLTTPLPNHNAYFPSAAAAYGESTFVCPGNFISNSYATHVSYNKVWNYRYNVQIRGFIEAGYGVPHTIESAAIFGLGNVGDNPSGDAFYGYSTYNANIVPVVMNYWISFIRSLNPNTYKYASAPQWDNFGTGSDGDKRLKLETNATAIEIIPLEQVRRCEFWRKLARTMEE